MKNSFSIPEVNVGKFEKAMNKLVKQSIKLGMGDVQYTLINKEFVTNDKETDLFYTYKVSGETPTLNGYILVAILEKQQDLNLIFHIDKEHTLPHGLETNTNHCEHCNHKRARKHLFILKNELTGRYIQVGKSCVKDFTGGHHSPDAVANYYQFIEEIHELENFISCTRVQKYINVIEAIAFSAYFTDKDGYVKTLYHSNDNPSTKNVTFEAIGNEEILAEVIKGNYFETAEKVSEWILAQEGNNDYIVNLKTLTKEGFVTESRLGFIVSAYSSYLKAISKKKEIKETVVSNHVGEVGKRTDFQLVFERVTWFETAYGTTYIYFFFDEIGNQLIWKTGNGVRMEKGNKVNLKATIKEHGEYRDIKQTVLTRCTKIEVA